MKRAHIVAGATVAGLAGVLLFHTSPAHVTLGAFPAATPPRGSTTASGASSTSTSTTRPSASGPPSTNTSTTAPSTRSATGDPVDYNYGVLSVSVTVSGSRITRVGIASLDDGGSNRSQSIDQQSIPILEQQAMQVQSANIQGVSGASYTSSGFAQSLQSALSKLGR
jgi:uncharacterized protein with FMN-binding domain